MRIAVLALQGAFLEHEMMLSNWGLIALRCANWRIGSRRKMG